MILPYLLYHEGGHRIRHARPHLVRLRDGQGQVLEIKDQMLSIFSALCHKLQLGFKLDTKYLAQENRFLPLLNGIQTIDFTATTD